MFHVFHVPLLSHTDLPFQQPPAPLQPTGGKHLMLALFGRNFTGTLQELAGTFLPELLLSPPPQKRNQTLLLSKLSSLSELCRNLLELCRNFAGTRRNCQNFRVVVISSRSPGPPLRFCFHTDLPFPQQPRAPLPPTGGKHLMFALFGRNFA